MCSIMKLPTKDNYHFEITNAEGAVSCAELMTAFYSEQILPFFQTYATRQSVGSNRTGRQP